MREMALWESPKGASAIVNESERLQKIVDDKVKELCGHENAYPSGAPVVFVERAENTSKNKPMWFMSTSPEEGGPFPQRVRRPEWKVLMKIYEALHENKEDTSQDITMIVIVMGDQEYDADIQPVTYPGHLTDEQIEKIFTKITETYKYPVLEDTEKKREYDFVGRAYSELRDMHQKENVKMTVYVYRSTFEDPGWCGVVHGGGMVHRKV